MILKWKKLTDPEENILTQATKMYYNIIKEKEREGKQRWAARSNRESKSKKVRKIRKKTVDKINKNMV